MTPEIRTPADTRWTCGGCGACCRGYSFGPVSERIIRGLEDADIGAHWPLAAERPFYERRVGPTGEAFYLSSVDGHCIFLREDNLCAVHAALGPAAKPAFCREFPFHLVEDERGLTAVIRADCKSWHESFDSAPPVAEAAAEVAAMERVIPLRQFSGTAVPIMPGVQMPMGEWLQLEDRIAAGLVTRRLPADHVAWIRQVLREAGVPVPEASDLARRTLAQRAILHGLHLMMQRVLTEDGGSPRERADAAARAESVRAVAAAIEGDWPSLDERTQDFLGAALRSVWTGRLWASGGDVAGGLGRWLFLVHCAQIEAGGGQVSVDDFAMAYHPWRRFAVNRTIAATLERARPALIDVFLTA